MLVFGDASIVWLSEAFACSEAAKITGCENLSRKPSVAPVLFINQPTQSERCIAFHRVMGFRFEMWPFQVSDYRLVNGPAEPPLTLYWPLCWVSTDTDGPYWSEDSSCVWHSPPPSRILPSPSHHARWDKGSPDVKSCRPKVWAEEKRRRKEKKWRKFKLWSPSPEGKLACHLCRLSSHSHHPWKRERRKAAG